MIENRVHYFNTFCHFLITNKKLNKLDRIGLVLKLWTEDREDRSQGRSC
jgi:hypothetical protein